MKKMFRRSLAMLVALTLFLGQLTVPVTAVTQDIVDEDGNVIGQATYDDAGNLVGIDQTTFVPEEGGQSGEGVTTELHVTLEPQHVTGTDADGNTTQTMESQTSNAKETTVNITEGDADSKTGEKENGEDDGKTGTNQDGGTTYDSADPQYGEANMTSEGDWEKTNEGVAGTPSDFAANPGAQPAAPQDIPNTAVTFPVTLGEGQRDAENDGANYDAYHAEQDVTDQILTQMGLTAPEGGFADKDALISFLRENGFAVVPNADGTITATKATADPDATADLDTPEATLDKDSTAVTPDNNEATPDFTGKPEVETHVAIQEYDDFIAANPEGKTTLGTEQPLEGGNEGDTIKTDSFEKRTRVEEKAEDGTVTGVHYTVETKKTETVTTTRTVAEAEYGAETTAFAKVADSEETTHLVPVPTPSESDTTMTEDTTQTATYTNDVGTSVTVNAVTYTSLDANENEVKETFVPSVGLDGQLFYTVTKVYTDVNGDIVTETWTLGTVTQTAWQEERFVAESGTVEVVTKTETTQTKTVTKKEFTQTTTTTQTGTVVQNGTIDATQKAYTFSVNEEGKTTIEVDGKVYEVVDNSTITSGTGLSETPAPEWYTEYLAWTAAGGDFEADYTWRGDMIFGHYEFAGIEFTQNGKPAETPAWYTKYLATNGDGDPSDAIDDNKYGIPVGGDWRYNGSGEYGYGLAENVGYYENQNTNSVTMMQIKDADGNIRTVYCIEENTGTSSGAEYEENFYLNDVSDSSKPDWRDHVAEINEVAKNGYWGTSSGMGSLAEVKAFLKANKGASGLTDEQIDGLTEKEAITATQWALWVYGSADNEDYRDDYHVSNNASVSDTGRARIEALKNALVAAGDAAVAPAPSAGTEGSQPEQPQQPAEPENNNIIYEEMKVTGETETAGVYKTDVSFRLEVRESALNDDLIVEIKQGGTSLGKFRLVEEGQTSFITSAADALSGTKQIVPNGNGSFTIKDLELTEGVNFTLNLTGVENLEPGVVYYENSQMQDFVGLVSRTSNIDLSMDMQFTVTEPTAQVQESDGTMSVSRDITYTKTNEYQHKKNQIATAAENSTYKIEQTEQLSVQGHMEIKRVTERTSDASWSKVIDYSIKDDDEEEVPPTTETTAPTEPDYGIMELDLDDDDDFVVIDDTAVPMAADPAIRVRPARNGDLTTIEDEDVPLADVPETGDPTLIWGAMGLISLAGSTFLGKKKKEEEEA